MKLLLTILFSFFFMSGVFSQTRNVLVNTSNVVVQPTNFWSADASNARFGLGLGSIATSSITSFQPSSAVLSNLASSNGVNITNLRATNLVGIIPSSNIPTASLTNISGVLAVTSGGTGATNSSEARTNLGLGTNDNLTIDTIVFPEATGLSSVAANGIQWRSIYPSGNGLIAISGTDDQGETTLRISTGTMSGTTAEVALFNANQITFYKPLDFNNTTNAAITRTNLGLGLDSSVAFSSLTLSSGATTNLSLTLGSTNRGFYATTYPDRIVTVVNGVNALQVFSNSVETATGISLSVSGVGSFGTNIQIGGSISFSGTNSNNNAGATRTNLNLGWSALTNSNSGTSLVSVNTNGSVVSPTNFWQVAPIQTLVYNFAPLSNSSTNISGARNIYVYSSATNVSGVTSTIILPTNGSTFVGDVATVIHRGFTSTVTAIKQQGATNNLISISNYDEAVKFIHENGFWSPYHNISFVEPIKFSGTNAALNAAGSRTNLGLGASDNVVFANVNSKLNAGGGEAHIIFNSAIEFDDIYSEEIISVTRTNLGIPLAALTNTNNAKFQEAIFATNAAPTNAANFGDHAAWMGISIVTNGVTNTFKIPLYK